MTQKCDIGTISIWYREAKENTQNIPQNPRVSGSCVSNISKLPNAAVSSDRVDDAGDETKEDVADEDIEVSEEADAAAESN